jgi:hypothetical protein
VAATPAPFQDVGIKGGLFGHWPRMDDGTMPDRIRKVKTLNFGISGPSRMITSSKYSPGLIVLSYHRILIHILQIPEK